MTNFLVFVLICAGVNVIDTARILAVFPSPSISHQVVFRVLIKGLVDRGHQVVVITTDPAYPKGQSPANLTEVDVHDISYDFARKILSKMVEKTEYGTSNMWVEQFGDMYTVWDVLEAQVEHEEVKKLIQGKSDQFDLLLIEAYFRPALVFSHIFKAPVIHVSSFGAFLDNLESVGAPTHPLLYPIPLRQRLYNLSTWEKLRELYFQIRFENWRNFHKQKENELLQRMFGPDIPSIDELSDNVEMLFLNVHPIWMDNQPVPPGVIYMGGLHQNPIKELPKDLKKYLDSSTNGVVYVSFGTNVLPTLLPEHRVKELFDALSALPYDVLLKWSDDNVAGLSNNVKISKWLPQSDLLRHPNVKVFLTQGGLQSTDEAITAGIPLVCIPMLGDQWYNAEKYVHLGIGVKLDFHTFTKSELVAAIENVITDQRYRENIANLRNRMKDQPQSPLERAVWWVEYVLRHGGAKHLRAPAANMSWTEYYEIKLVLGVLSCLLCILLAVLYTSWLIYHFVSRLFCTNTKIKIS